MHAFVATTLLLCIFTKSEIVHCVVRIHKIHVPSYVENGTNSNIVLDCVYTLDAKEDWQLVVKWWWNDDPIPIYQWIPEFGARTASGRYESKINLDYFIETGDALTKYRAINILTPTTDLSGVYRCDVSSMKSQASKESVMIVYAPPKTFEFNYTRGAPNNAKPETAERTYAAQQTSPGALLICDIKEVYPSPDVTIYRVDSDGSNPFLLDVHRSEQVLQQNLLRVLVTVNVNDVQLLERFGGQPSIFECLVTIPLPDKKNLYYKKQITYIPVVETPIFANYAPGQYNPTSLLLFACFVTLAMVL